MTAQINNQTPTIVGDPKGKHLRVSIKDGNLHVQAYDGDFSRPMIDQTTIFGSMIIFTDYEGQMNEKMDQWGKEFDELTKPKQ